MFCSFLNQIPAAYPDASRIAVRCDNDSIHHSGITREWLAAPACCRSPSPLQPTEQPRRTHLGRTPHWIANITPATMADRIRQAHAFFRHRTPDQMLATATPWLPDGYGHNPWKAAQYAAAHK
nr:hypothetical protein [Longimycelium tulufanense]